VWRAGVHVENKHISKATDLTGGKGRARILAHRSACAVQGCLGLEFLLLVEVLFRRRFGDCASSSLVTSCLCHKPASARHAHKLTAQRGLPTAAQKPGHIGGIKPCFLCYCLGDTIGTASATQAVRCPPCTQDVILMADSCDVCGYKNAAVKGSGGISERGRRITLRVAEPDDLRRDVIKAETASVPLPTLPAYTSDRARTLDHVSREFMKSHVSFNRSIPDAWHTEGLCMQP